MKISEHEESFKEHKETIFRWALEVKGMGINREKSLKTIAVRKVVNK